MEFKKRHLILVALSFLPFFNLIHFNDYCFGVAELLIIGGLTIVFFIAFLVISFYDLYNLSIKKLRFNFVPLIIVFVFSVFLFVGIKFEGKFMFKNEVKEFKKIIDGDNASFIILFTDKTFEVKHALKNKVCTKKGTYYFKKDSLYLNKNDKSLKDVIFDSIYYYNKKEYLLIPKNKLLATYKAEK